MDKQELRKLLKKQRQALAKEQVAASGELVAAQLLATENYRQAQRILGYLAFGKELPVDKVLQQALADGKEVYVPYIISETKFEAVRLKNWGDFAYDRYGIRSVKEPVEMLDPRELDLILVPGVAFSRKLERMGMGAGYYDRFLARASQAVKIGIAYEALLQPEILVDEYDVLMDYLVTEQGLVQL